MKRSTIFILLFLVLIAAAILYYLWRKSEPPAPGLAPSLVSLLPEDASYVFYADAAALRSSIYVQKLLAALPSPKEDRAYAEFVRRTGFDYARDLDRVAAAVVPTSKGDLVVAIAEGRFDRQRISEYAKNSPHLVRYRSPDTYVFSAGNSSAWPVSSSPEEFVLTFLSESRILLAQGVAAQQSLTFSREPPTISSNAPLNERIARVAGSELFAVARVPAAAGKSLLPEDWVSKEIQQALASVRWVTLALRPEGQAARPSGEAIRIVLEAECESAGDARQLAWGLEGLRVLARAALPGEDSGSGTDPALAALVKTILKDGKITSADRYVRLSFSLGPDFLAALTPPPAPSKKHGR